MITISFPRGDYTRRSVWFWFNFFTSLEINKERKLATWKNNNDYVTLYDVLSHVIMSLFRPLTVYSPVSLHSSRSRSSSSFILSVSYEPVSKGTMRAIKRDEFRCGLWKGYLSDVLVMWGSCDLLEGHIRNLIDHLCLRTRPDVTSLMRLSVYQQGLIGEKGCFWTFCIDFGHETIKKASKNLNVNKRH